MRVGIDEAGEEEGIPKLDDLRPARCRVTRSHVGDPPSLDTDRPVRDRRTSDGKDPTGGVETQ